MAPIGPLVEIKSATLIRADHIQGISSLGALFPDAELFCLCQEPLAKKIGKVHVLPWRQGIATILHSDKSFSKG